MLCVIVSGRLPAEAAVSFLDDLVAAGETHEGGGDEVCVWGGGYSGEGEGVCVWKLGRVGGWGGGAGGHCRRCWDLGQGACTNKMLSSTPGDGEWGSVCGMHQPVCGISSGCGGWGPSAIVSTTWRWLVGGILCG